jgi:hypothetical protein
MGDAKAPNRWLPPLLTGLVVLSGARVRAETLDTPEAGLGRAEWLQKRGNGEQARELLRRLAAKYPASELLAVARADSYLRDSNPFWALRVLDEFILAHPPACQARALAARVHIQQANLDQADALLAQPGCEEPEEARVRTLLLMAEIRELRGDAPAAKRYVLEADTLGRRYAEDDDRLTLLVARHDPYRLPAATWTMDLGGGWTTLGMAGAPIDRVAPAHARGSALSTFNLRARVVASPWKALRPVADAGLGLTQLFAPSVRGLSTRQPQLRLGALFGRGYPRLLAAYAYDLVHLQGDAPADAGPFVYSQAHRGEYELEVTRSTVAFGAFGHRRFHESARTRFESESGLVNLANLSDTLKLTTALSGHAFQAHSRAYHQLGSTGYVRLDLVLPRRFELRENFGLSLDAFPVSAGAYAGTGRARRDTLVRVGAGLWSPESAGLRLALDYEYTSRSSTVPSYDYDDHRVLLHVVWSSDSDRMRVRRIPAEGRVALRHQPTEAPTGPGVAVRDLMRQDEAVRRSSSCLK